MKSKSNKTLLVVGDRVLVRPENEERTSVGLYLPQGSTESMHVRSGKIIECGPGSPLGTSMQSGDEEEWRPTRNRPQPLYFPMQPKIDDTALFFSRAAVEIRFEGETFLIVPEGAILVLIRDPETPAEAAKVPDELPEDIR